jgi:hypothetical protein
LKSLRRSLIAYSNNGRLGWQRILIDIRFENLLGNSKFPPRHRFGMLQLDLVGRAFLNPTQALSLKLYCSCPAFAGFAITNFRSVSGKSKLASSTLPSGRGLSCLATKP